MLDKRTYMYYLVTSGCRFNLKDTQNRIYCTWQLSIPKVFEHLASSYVNESSSSLTENTILYEFSELPTYEYIQSNYPELLI
jgi:hypothetical protein